jgi:hypothetical protein
MLDIILYAIVVIVVIVGVVGFIIAANSDESKR